MKKKYLVLTLLMLLAAATQAQQSLNPTAMHTLRIKYRYASTMATAAPDTVLRLNANTQYSIVSPTITGYTPDRPIVQGKMPDMDVVDSVLYTINSYRVTLACSPTEGGTATGEGTFNHGTSVTVSASAKPGFVFAEWKEGSNSVSNNPRYTFTITSNRNLTACFAVDGHTVDIDPEITHGTVSVSPDGVIPAGETVTITATPDELYQLETLSAYKKGEPSQTVTINNNSFVMPDFDVTVTAVFTLQLPVITGNIVTPQAICSGEALELTAPSVTNADRQGWQMSPDEYFQNVVNYTGQALDASHNGWKLRFWASNAAGFTYSNTVAITINVLEPTLTGDLHLCTLQTGTYTASGVGNADLNWTTSDEEAILVPSGKTLKVTWANAGQHTLSMTAEDTETGCVATTTLEVTVVSYVDSNDLNKIVAKKDNGKDYILIYPNPKEPYKYQWYKDGEAIKGANGQYLYQPGGLDEGTYKVYLSFNADNNGNLFGGAFTKDYIVSNTSTLCLSPNPMQHGGVIRVTNGTGEEAVISIHSLDGKLLHRQTISGTEATLNLNLPQGIYMVQLTDSADNTSTEKLIVK